MSSPVGLISHFLMEQALRRSGRRDLAGLVSAYGIYSLVPAAGKQAVVRVGVRSVGHLIPDSPTRYKPGTYRGPRASFRTPTPSLGGSGLGQVALGVMIVAPIGYYLKAQRENSPAYTV